MILGKDVSWTFVCEILPLKQSKDNAVCWPAVNHAAGVPYVTSVELCVMSALKQLLDIIYREFITLNRKQLKRNKSVICRVFFFLDEYQYNFQL